MRGEQRRSKPKPSNGSAWRGASFRRRLARSADRGACAQGPGGELAFDVKHAGAPEFLNRGAELASLASSRGIARVARLDMWHLARL